MRLTDAVDLDMLRRYVARLSTPEEEASVQAWVCTSPERAQEVESLRTLHEQSVALLPDVNVDAAWQRMPRRSSIAPARPAPRPVSPLWRYAAVGAAAVTVVLAVVVGSGWPRLSQPVHEFTTAPGNHATVTLRDGTRLVLGPATRLVVPADFGRRGRTVQLDGEAYFAVRHNAEHPFAVQVGNVTVRDIGTVFDVRGYRNDDEIHVGVIEGQVGVGTTTLSAGDRAAIDHARLVVTHHADVADMVAWVQGRLVFRDTPLAEVVRTIQRAYGITITVADSSLLARPVTADFGDDSVDEVLDIVTRVVGARYERRGHVVAIRRKESAVHEPGATSHVPLNTVDRTRAE